MGQHRALAAAGGAAGVQDRGQVVGLHGHTGVGVAAMGGAVQQAAGAVVAQREHVGGAGREGDLADPAEVLRAADHHRGLGVADEIFHFAALVGGVERQKHITRPQRGQVQHGGFDRLLHLHGYTRACGQVQRGQQVGEFGRALLQVAPGVEQAVVGLHRDGIEVGRKSGAQGGEQIVVRLLHGFLEMGWAFFHKGLNAFTVFGAVGIAVGRLHEVYYRIHSTLRPSFGR